MNNAMNENRFNKIQRLVTASRSSKKYTTSNTGGGKFSHE